MTEYNLTDIMIGILNYFPKDTFKNDRETIHKAFYEVRKEHFSILKNFLFRVNIFFPRSKRLDDVLSSLQPSILGKINPSFDTYEIKRHALEKRWKEEVEKKLKDKVEINELERIGKELGEIIIG